MLLIGSAFNVFIGTAMLTELISFAFPAALLMWRRRDLKYLPRKGPFKLGKFGWLVNSLVVGWAAFALVIFSLPVTRHVTPGSMSKSQLSERGCVADILSLYITPLWFFVSWYYSPC